MSFLRRILFTGIALAGASSLYAGQLNPLRGGERAVPNQYIVMMSPGVEGTNVLPGLLPSGSSLTSLGHGMHLVRLPIGAGAEVPGRIAQHSLVQFVEPNRIRHTTIQAVNDPNYSTQWDLATVQALQAWSLLPGQYLTGSTPESGRIKVAVIDTGIDCTHPDFINAGGSSTDAAHGGQISFTLSKAFIPTTISSPACPWQDDQGHGTHVAGTIAAATNNGMGVASLGYPLELIAYKVADSSGNADDSTLASAIMSAADAGARVVSVSLGGPGYSQALQGAINYAWQRNTLVVAAAGNGGSSGVFFPADANYAVAVAATDSNNNIASFSNFGNSISVSAPGVGIFSTAPTYSVPLGIQNYGTLSGTSMSTPHVSALAGLVAMTTPNLPAESIIQRIQQSASSSIVNGGWNQNYGYGVINAFDAISGTLRPASTGSITGQALTAFGFPQAVATITVNGQTVTTDGSGLYRFANLAPGTYTITASTSSYPTQTISAAVVAGADTPTSIVFGVSYGSFKGTVTENGGPVAGAVVQALSNGVTQATGVTDGSGQYSLWVQGGGTFNIQASAISSQSASALAQTVSAGSSATVNLSLSSLGFVDGAVQDASHAAVAGAQVLVSGGTFSAGATTDGNGNYRTLGLPAGTYSVTVTAAGSPSATVNNIAVGSSGVAVNVTIAGVTVALSPASVTLTAGKSQSFTATVTGSPNTNVTWSMNPSAGTLVAGNYTAPSTLGAAQTITITATSVADPTKVATATVSLSPAPISVTVSPGTMSLSAGQSQQFTATVTGNNNTAVSWSLNPANGSIVNGLYTAPATVPSPASVQVIATSAADGKTSNFATVSLVAQQPGVSISPLAPTLTSSQTQQFTATTTGLAPGVTWSIYPSTKGSITATGQYTAPASIPALDVVSITARSVANPNYALTTIAYLQPGVGVVLTPQAVALTAGQSQQFFPTVSGSSNQAVTWSMNPAIGTLNAGVYTPPSTISGGQTVTITATSVADPTKSAKATVTLNPSGVTVSLSPGQVTLASGQSQAFVATVNGSNNPNVTWSMSPSLGSMNNGTYTAPTAVTATQTVTITATSVADPTKIANATVTLQPTVGISINPGKVSLTSGQSQTFSATVSGSNNPNVTWSVSPSLGSLNNGTYTAPTAVTATQTVTITATSVADPTKTANAIVTLQPTVGVSISPGQVTLTSSQSQTFSATVNGSNNPSVTWSMSPSLGALNNGTYTAPTAVAATQTVTITATSVADPTKTANAIVTLQPTVGVSISPGQVTLTNGQSQTFSATVNGSNNPNVTWSMSPSLGALSNGTYTAPTAVTATQTVTITATSVGDSSKTANAIVTLQPTVGVSISPGQVTLTSSQSQTFSATVSGSSNPSVTWSMSPSLGALNNGTYTAPANIAFTQTVTITATSATDFTKSANATVTLQPTVGISMSPSQVTLTNGQSQVFTATVSGSPNTGVAWSMTPSTGTLTNGFYTAPSTIAATQAVTITATSIADPSKSANATVILQPTSSSVSVALNLSAITVSTNQVQPFIARVTGTSNTAVTWSLSQPIGTINPNGVYVAPIATATQEIVHVIATSVADPTKSAIAAVTIRPSIYISVSPQAIWMSRSQTQQFAATVTGGSQGLGVTWSVYPSNLGTMSPTGLYQAPANISTLSVVTITATSIEDPSRSVSTIAFLLP